MQEIVASAAERASRRRVKKARKQRERAAGPRFTPEEWQALKEKYGHRCLCCGLPEGWYGPAWPTEDGPPIRSYRCLVPDHVVSLNDGGNNSIANIQPLCDECNGRKGARSIDYRPIWTSRQAEGNET